LDQEFEANPPAEPLAKVGGSGLFRQLLESEPAFNPPHYYLSQLYAMTGHFGDAVTEFQKGTGIAGSWSADAQSYNRLVTQRSNDVRAPAVVALSFALAGNRDKAFEYFEKAYAIEDGDSIFTLRYPALASTPIPATLP